jgi:hypothetical protein
MKKQLKPLSGLSNQENKDWYNAGFKGGYKDCKEKILKILKSPPKSYINNMGFIIEEVEKL